MKKIFLMLLALFLVTGCFGTNEERQEDNNVLEEQGVEENPVTPIEPEVNDDEELPIMTIEEVAENNGIDGANAYVIVNNIVYDVTDSPRWSNGLHNDFQAGQDLTEEIENISPHGISVLDRMEKVGQIAD